MSEEEKFQPFQKVLMRHGDVGQWEPHLFGYAVGIYYMPIGGRAYYEQCIDYEGNEELLLTKNPPQPKFKNGDKVIVSSPVEAPPFLSRDGTYEAVYVKDGDKEAVNGRLLPYCVVVRGDTKLTEWCSCEHADW